VNLSSSVFGGAQLTARTLNLSCLYLNSCDACDVDVRTAYDTHAADHIDHINYILYMPMHPCPNHASRVLVRDAMALSFQHVLYEAMLPKRQHCWPLPFPLFLLGHSTLRLLDSLPMAHSIPRMAMRTMAIIAITKTSILGP
jgi:hypothetical protein